MITMRAVTKPVLLLSVALFGCGRARAQPVATPQAAGRVAVCDAVWRDAVRDRDVPVRIRVPDVAANVPVILFSHGLGGSLDAGTEWAQHWSAQGFGVIHMQHPGSDEDLMDDARGIAGRLGALRDGMSGAQLIARAEDVAFVLDQLGKVRREGQCDVTRLDATRVGMSGHSFGAHTTQAVAGQVFGVAGRRTLRDARIDAAIAFSPAPPNASDRAVRAAFAEIDMPFFSITGTRDEVPVLNDVSPDDRTLPYRYMPPGEKYLLVFEGADHAAFSGGGGRRSNADAHVPDVIGRMTLAFWRATLLDDADAQRWLEGPEPARLLKSGDRFERK
jgi:predicted dienelactone hydrolase